MGLDVHPSSLQKSKMQLKNTTYKFCRDKNKAAKVIVNLPIFVKWELFMLPSLKGLEKTCIFQREMALKYKVLWLLVYNDEWLSHSSVM